MVFECVARFKVALTTLSMAVLAKDIALTINVKAQLMERDAIYVQSLLHL